MENSSIDYSIYFDAYINTTGPIRNETCSFTEAIAMIPAP